MQWEGQDLQTQLFSPNGHAQEVPVRNHFLPKLLINNFKIFISLSPFRFLFSVGLLFLRFCFPHFLLQDLLTSALLSDDGHKTYHLSRRDMDSPLQVCFSCHSCICTSILHVIKLNVRDRLTILAFFLPGQQQLNSWEPEKCGKTEEHVFASEQSHKYLNTYSTRTLVM